MNENRTDRKTQSEASLQAADLICSALDEALIKPMRWEVCSRLAGMLPECQGLRDEALAMASRGSRTDRAQLAKRLWHCESELPFWEGAKFRILVGLTNDDGPLDGLESDYLIEFADLSGIPTNQIVEAFGLTNGS